MILLLDSPISLPPGLGLLFDMDGVLIDSTVLHTQAWEIYLRRLGSAQDGIPARMLGKRNDQILRDFYADAMTEEEIFRHGAAKEQLYREMMGPQLEQKLVPGVRRFLERVSPAPCGLATNAEPANVDFVLDGGNLRGFFRAIVDGHQVMNPKPSPDVYLLAASRLGIEPGNCVVFEDSLGGVAAALAAGASVIGLETTRDDLPGVAFSVKDFLDPRIPAWLASRQVS